MQQTVVNKAGLYTTNVKVGNVLFHLRRGAIRASLKTAVTVIPLGGISWNRHPSVSPLVRANQLAWAPFAMGHTDFVSQRWVKVLYSPHLPLHTLI